MSYVLNSYLLTYLQVRTGRLRLYEVDDRSQCSVGIRHWQLVLWKCMKRPTVRGGDRCLTQQPLTWILVSYWAVNCPWRYVDGDPASWPGTAPPLMRTQKRNLDFVYNPLELLRHSYYSAVFFSGVFWGLQTFTASTRDKQRFTASKVAADCRQLMEPGPLCTADTNV